MKKLEESERTRKEAEEAALAAKRELEDQNGEGESDEGKEDDSVRTDLPPGTIDSRPGSKARSAEPLDLEGRLKKEEMEDGKAVLWKCPLSVTGIWLHLLLFQSIIYCMFYDLL